MSSGYHFSKLWNVLPQIFDTRLKRCTGDSKLPTQSSLFTTRPLGLDGETTVCLRMSRYFMRCDVCWLNVLCFVFTSLQPAFPCQDVSQLVHAVVQEWKSQSESYYWNMNVSQAMCHCFSSRVVCISSRSGYLIDDSRPKYRQNNSLRRTRLGF